MKKKDITDAAWQAVLSAMRERKNTKDETDADIGRLLGVNRGTVGVWLREEKGGQRTSVKNMLHYMEKLGIDSAQYFGSEGESGYVQVPWLEATASMGGGSVEVSKDIISHLSFRADWLRAKGPAAYMSVINASGDSMHPTITDGSVVLINEMKPVQPSNGKIYFVRRGEEIFLKRLKVEKGRVTALISDNGDIEDPLEPTDDFEVIGKALWVAKELP